MTNGNNDLLSALGFVRGTGFDGEVWTNTESEWMAQVWVWFGGKFTNDHMRYDARNGFDLAEFFKWWEKVSSNEFYQDQAHADMGDDL